MVQGAEMKMKRARRGVAFLCVSAMVALAFTMVSSKLLGTSRTFADTTITEEALITVTSSCEMTAVVDTVHETTVTASTYADDIGETTITVVCNDANGYAIYATGFTNNEFGRNDMLGQTTGRTIATGTADSGNTSAWAMKLAAVSNSVAPTIVTGYDDYHAVPNDYTKVASFADSTMENPDGSKFKTTYAAFVASSQAPDTYSGKVKYTLVHPADTTDTPCNGTYTIIYNRNGGTGSMDSQTACVDRAIGLLPNGFTPPAPVDENRFGLWTTEPDGGGYTYVAGQSVTNIVDAGETVTLYAQWAPKYMHDFTNSMCKVFATENPFTVYDKRDGNDYTVRYIENACWMTQNLRIKGMVNRQYSNFSTNENINVCEGDLTAGNSYDEPRCHDSENTINGVWYNYAAASAGTIVGSSNSGTATENICPAGWTLPDHDINRPAGSIDSLISTTGTSLSKFSYVSAGCYDGGNISTGPWWWTSTAIDGTIRYKLTVSSGKLAVSTSFNSCRWRRSGNSIRCVRKNSTIEDVEYMQDVTPEVVESMEEGATATLTDRRDGNTYTVAKIQGALWMTQNLRITGAVSAQGSNFSTNSSVNVCEGDLTAGNSYDEPRCHDSGNTTDGVWYNYAAASAETVVGGSNAAIATEDICPAGWSLPSYDTNNIAGSINSLISTSATSYRIFGPVISGRYWSGSLGVLDSGLWWSTQPASSSSSSLRSLLSASSSNLGLSSGDRVDGNTIRCVHL